MPSILLADQLVQICPFTVKLFEARPEARPEARSPARSPARSAARSGRRSALPS